MTLSDLAGKGQEAVEDHKRKKEQSSSSNYPRSKTKVPYLAIYWDGDELVCREHPQDQIFLVYEKKTKNSQYKLKHVPEELEKYWWNRVDFSKTRYRVKNELGLDIADFIKSDPAKALKCIKRAANPDAASKVPMTESCPVCREDIHVLNDEYEMVGHRRVCTHHNVHDLKEADLI